MKKKIQKITKQEEKKLVRVFLAIDNNSDVRFRPQNKKEYNQMWKLLNKAKDLGIIKINW